MGPPIAIPMPHSLDREYSERAVRQYERAVEFAGATAVRVPLDESEAEVLRIAQNCAGILLPGSKADIEPTRFRAARSKKTAEADRGREAVDNQLLEHAYDSRKPVLGICYGLQSLNVWSGGSLIQHIPDFLSPELRGKVNHEAGKDVTVAHTVKVESGSRLAAILQTGESSLQVKGIPVNSSHHQSAETLGKNLRITAHCAEDGIIEALEGTSKNHFVLAVQWHPERTIENDKLSRAIFRAFVRAAG